MARRGIVARLAPRRASLIRANNRCAGAPVGGRSEVGTEKPGSREFSTLQSNLPHRVCLEWLEPGSDSETGGMDVRLLPGEHSEPMNTTLPAPVLSRIAPWARRWGLTVEMVKSAAEARQIPLSVVELGARGIAHAPATQLAALDDQLVAMARVDNPPAGVPTDAS